MQYPGMPLASRQCELVRPLGNAAGQALAHLTPVAVDVGGLRHLEVAQQDFRGHPAQRVEQREKRRPLAVVWLPAKPAEMNSP